MTDRELIELAAKAAGLDLGRWDEKRECINYPFRSELTDGHSWNPLADDGDALRLAVKLRLSPIPQANGVAVTCWRGMAPKHSRGITEEYGDDPYAATRRAIVRVAAEIGQQERAA